MRRISRRMFCCKSAAFLGAFATAISFPIGLHAAPFGRRNLYAAKIRFAMAIIDQKGGYTESAKENARMCLYHLAGLDTAEETAAGEVVSYEGYFICEPDFLHTDTALQRFRSEGIMV